MKEQCKCGNPQFGFPCTCSFVAKYPGNKTFSCEFCGLYTAGTNRCSACEECSDEIRGETER
jgi:hypothetical protein